MKYYALCGGKIQLRGLLSWAWTMGTPLPPVLRREFSVSLTSRKWLDHCPHSTLVSVADILLAIGE